MVSERDEENARVMTCAVTCPIDVLDVQEDHRDGQRLNQQSLMVDVCNSLFNQIFWHKGSKYVCGSHCL